MEGPLDQDSWPSPEVLEIIAEKETHDTLRQVLDGAMFRV